jgi:hypothetical protein
MHTPLDDAEIAQLRTLLEVEAIRQLHIDYSMAMDERDFDKLALFFADDVLCEYGPYGSWSGKKTVLENYRKTFTGDLAPPFTSQHINTNHTVELLSPTLAKGRCYLLDVATHVAPDENPLLWFALYDEEYRKERGRWVFTRTSLQFFWPQRHVTTSFDAVEEHDI